MSGRKHPPHVYRELKAQTRNMIKHLGGLEKATSMTRVKRATLANYYDPGKEIFIPIDVVADLEEHCEGMPVTEALAHLKSVLIVPVKSDPDDADFLCELGDVADEIGNVFRTAAEAIASEGEIDDKATKELRDAIRKSLKTLLELEQALDNKLGA